MPKLSKVSIARCKFAKYLAYGDLPLFEGQTWHENDGRTVPSCKFKNMSEHSHLATYTRAISIMIYHDKASSKLEARQQGSTSTRHHWLVEFLKQPFPFNSPRLNSCADPAGPVEHEIEQPWEISCRRDDREAAAPWMHSSESSQQAQFFHNHVRSFHQDVAS